MTLANERFEELGAPAATTADERALRRCRAAAELTDAGQYQAACEALGDFWRGVGQRPRVEGLRGTAAAEVLLQAGVLTGRLGASQQVEGAQEAAKDLISEGAALFEHAGQPDRVAAARADLAMCYCREGAYDEARVTLESAAALIRHDSLLRARTMLRLAIVEVSAGRYGEALRLLTDSAPLFGEGVSHALRSSFHNEMANVLQFVGKAERRDDCFDRAIIEYTASIYHAELAGHEQYIASTENNLAFLLYELGRYADAHAHLDRAETTLARLKDAGRLAQVCETRARVLLAERKHREAEHVIAQAVESFEQGDDAALLAGALTVQGVVWARLGSFEDSVEALRRAADAAEGCGAHAQAGLALLALIEEHGATRRLLADELYEAYERADALLRDVREAEATARLRDCARLVMRRMAGPQVGDLGFTMYGAVNEYEARLIERALEAADGSVTHAARVLGLSHQTLGTILNTRHKHLADKRTPVRRRLRSIIKRPKAKPGC
ncbi:MAG TPA: tetratricopeptide repeat protein [Pyrinomonadaceae bacterium]|jgi:tetratricopeptide (TPR) repeat protein